MKLIVDECLAESTVALLQNLGFEVIRIGSILDWGAADEETFICASKQQIPLITHDRRYGKIYFDSMDEPATTIILQVRSPHPEATNILLNNAVSKLDLTAERLQGKLILISSRSIRIRQKLDKYVVGSSCVFPQ